MNTSSSPDAKDPFDAPDFRLDREAMLAYAMRTHDNFIEWNTAVGYELEKKMQSAGIFDAFKRLDQKESVVAVEAVCVAGTINDKIADIKKTHGGVADCSPKSVKPSPEKDRSTMAMRFFEKDHITAVGPSEDYLKGFKAGIEAALKLAGVK